MLAGILCHFINLLLVHVGIVIGTVVLPIPNIMDILVNKYYSILFMVGSLYI